MLFKHPQWKGSKRKLCAAISAVSLMPLSGMAPAQDDQIEEIVSIPGIAFAEVGPTDMSYALGISKVEVPLTGEVAEIEKRLKEACKANGVPFHPFTGHHGPDGIPDIIDEGGRYFTSPSEEIAIAGRAHTKRSMPV